MMQITKERLTKELAMLGQIIIDTQKVLQLLGATPEAETQMLQRVGDAEKQLKNILTLTDGQNLDIDSIDAQVLFNAAMYGITSRPAEELTTNPTPAEWFGSTVFLKLREDLNIL